MRSVITFTSAKIRRKLLAHDPIAMTYAGIGHRDFFVVSLAESRNWAGQGTVHGMIGINIIYHSRQLLGINWYMLFMTTVSDNRQKDPKNAIYYNQNML